MPSRSQTQPNELKMALVSWVDSEAIHGWDPVERYIDNGMVECESLGFLVKQDEHSTMLVQSVDLKNGNVSEGIHIPRDAIRRIKYLKR